MSLSIGLQKKSRVLEVLVILVSKCNTTADSQRIVTIVFLIDEVEQTKLFYKCSGPIHKLYFVYNPY